VELLAADDRDQARGGGGEKDKKKLGAQIYSEEFLVKRPLARALEGRTDQDAPVLLIDELDRTDEPFEAYLLEVLSDWQITIPEIGTLRPPSRRSWSSPRTARARSTMP